MLAGPFSEHINAASELMKPTVDENGEGGDNYYEKFGEPSVCFGNVDWDGNTRYVSKIACWCTARGKEPRYDTLGEYCRVCGQAITYGG
jgi:hypothetical protein